MEFVEDLKLNVDNALRQEGAFEPLQDLNEAESLKLQGQGDRSSTKEAVDEKDLTEIMSEISEVKELMERIMTKTYFKYLTKPSEKKEQRREPINIHVPKPGAELAAGLSAKTSTVGETRLDSSQQLEQSYLNQLAQASSNNSESDKIQLAGVGSPRNGTAGMFTSTSRIR